MLVQWRGKCTWMLHRRCPFDDPWRTSVPRRSVVHWMRKDARNYERSKKWSNHSDQSLTLFSTIDSIVIAFLASIWSTHGMSSSIHLRKVRQRHRPTTELVSYFDRRDVLAIRDRYSDSDWNNRWGIDRVDRHREWDWRESAVRRSTVESLRRETACRRHKLHLRSSRRKQAVSCERRMFHSSMPKRKGKNTHSTSLLSGDRTRKRNVLERSRGTLARRTIVSSWWKKKKKRSSSHSTELFILPSWIRKKKLLNQIGRFLKKWRLWACRLLTSGLVISTSKEGIPYCSCARAAEDSASIIWTRFKLRFNPIWVLEFRIHSSSSLWGSQSMSSWWSPSRRRRPWSCSWWLSPWGGSVGVTVTRWWQVWSCFNGLTTNSAAWWATCSRRAEPWRFNVPLAITPLPRSR